MSKKRKNEGKRVAKNKYANMKPGDGVKEQRRRAQRGGGGEAFSDAETSERNKTPADSTPNFEVTASTPPPKSKPRNQTDASASSQERPPAPLIIVPEPQQIIHAPAVFTSRPSGTAGVMPAETLDDLW